MNACVLTKKRNWLAIREFAINPVSEEEYGWDGNPFTSRSVEGSIEIEICSGCYSGKQSLDLMLGELSGNVKYRIYNDFAEHSSGEITSSRASIELPMTDIESGKWRIELVGDFDLYELFYR